jgi:hypothetical protein
LSSSLLEFWKKVHKQEKKGKGSAEGSSSKNEETKESTSSSSAKKRDAFIPKGLKIETGSEIRNNIRRLYIEILQTPIDNSE